LKIAENLSHEAHALRQFNWTPLASPEVVGYWKDVDGLEILLTKRLPGKTAKQVAAELKVDSDKRKLVAEIAKALRQLHKLPFPETSCCRKIDHFDVAEKRLRDGLVPLRNFSAKYGVKESVRSYSDLQKRFQRLVETRPEGDLVFLHGDPCLPSFLVGDGQNGQILITGTIDVGSACVGERGVDLALASWSVGYNLGTDYVDLFVEEYGLSNWSDIREYYQELTRFLC